MCTGRFSKYQATLKKKPTHLWITNEWQKLRISVLMKTITSILMH